MTIKTWVILGATSIIAEEFAHLAAQAGCTLLLVARNQTQLEVISADLRLRYHVQCDFLVADFAGDLTHLTEMLNQHPNELALFIAYSHIVENDTLDTHHIEKLIKTNVLSTVQLINHYLRKQQSMHQLIFLSSVAACRGRAKNSLYGASKAAIEIYLEGLQQAAENKTQITIARLGFIDTAQTYGLEGIFYASPPKVCAEACWRATKRENAYFTTLFLALYHGHHSLPALLSI
ncbi:SDR family NAD(P)-dependent oxidoreductase [Legionella tunisiensis]|uniref:SDR family NAD(P)-dependent oxidoreductase n=1 Tax=Legionella tunisiensis TaxID=1034944 RepID=UPI00031C3D1B|nr:SDR family NAD(P)-dependent oxidoreductase [Legionella tunisiensis]